ncbi:hypothetical protein TcCL_NonESM07034, partial [Trypanosoma cruzi]
LSVLLLVVSVMRLRCTFFVRLSTYSSPSFLLLCFVFLQAHTTTHKMHIAVDLNASFVACAGSCVWLLSSSVAMRRGSVQPESLFLWVWSTACDWVELGSVSH